MLANGHLDRDGPVCRPLARDHAQWGTYEKTFHWTPDLPDFPDKPPGERPENPVNPVIPVSDPDDTDGESPVIPVSEPDETDEQRTVGDGLTNAAALDDFEEF